MCSSRSLTRSHLTLLLVLLGVVSLFAPYTSAQPAFDSLINVVQWTAAEGGNDHWYAVFKYRMPWMAADSAVATMEWNGLPVYLATITSQDENNFVYGSVIQGPDDTVETTRQLYLGASYWNGWYWQTHEAFGYLNWASGEPNNLGIENGIAMKASNGTWNNVYQLGSWSSVHQEWSIVEWGVADSAVAPPDSLIHLAQWPASEGGNDHWYGVYPQRVSWENAVAIAQTFDRQSYSGYLATVTSASENQFIVEHVMPGLDTVGSLGQLYLGGTDEAGFWKWLTGENLSYENWASGEPNNAGIETAIAMFYPSGYWNSVRPSDVSGSIHREWSIVEFGPLDSSSQMGDSLVHLVQWSTAEGGNDHWYAVFPARVSWENARIIASTFSVDTLSGYLATVTSAAENAFIFEHVFDGLDTIGTPFQLYLGGYYADDIIWQWITQEMFSYMNWASGEPNNLDDETALAMRFGDGFWNNVLPNDLLGSIHREWSVIEFGGYTPTIPDTVLNLTEWRVAENGNGHWYGVIAIVQPWVDARDFAQSTVRLGVPGNLATILTPEENAFILGDVIKDLVPPTVADQYYLGGHMTTFIWSWQTGEEFTYTNWAPGEPSQTLDEPALAMWGITNTAPNRPPGYWNNVQETDLNGPVHRQWSIVEWVPCCIGATGNINDDPSGQLDLSDLIYLVNYLFSAGPPPPCMAAANINGDPDCNVDLSDLIYLVGTLFLSGPPPAPCIADCL